MTAKDRLPEEIRRLLPLRVSDDLSEDQTRQVDEQARYSEECRTELAAFERTVSVLREVGATPIPELSDRPSLWSRLEPRMGPAGRHQRPARYWVSTRNLAVACAVLLSVTLFVDRSGQPPAPMARGPWVQPDLSALAPVDQTLPLPQDIVRPKLGMIVQPITRELMERLRLDSADGVVIADVVPGSAAAQAGLQTADVIVAIDGVKIHSVEELADLIGRAVDGHVVEVEFVRDGFRFESSLRLGGVDGQMQLPGLNGRREHRDENLLLPHNDAKDLPTTHRWMADGIEGRQLSSI